MVFEEAEGFLHRHIQHFTDILSLPGDFQGLPVIPAAVADVTGDIQIRQEVHLNPLHTVSLAGLAAAALDVEGEAVFLIAPGLGLRAEGKQLADQVKQAGIGGRIAPGRPADGALVDHDDLVQLFQPVHAVKRARTGLRPVQHTGQVLVQDLIHQAALSAAAHAGHAGQHAQGNLHVDMLQVMLRSAVHSQVPGGFPPLLRHGNELPAAQVLPRQAVRAGFDILRRTLRYDVAAVDARPGANVHNPVRRHHGFLVVFHHDHGIADIPHPPQRCDQLCVVPLVQADGRLVQDVHHTHQRAADLGSQADPLRFAARKRPRAAAEGQVFQAHVAQEAQPGVNLLQDLRRDNPVIPAQLQVREELPGLLDAHIADFRQALSAHGYRPGFRLQALPAAFRTGFLRHVFLIGLFHGVRGSFPVPSFQGRDDALKAGGIFPRSVGAFIGNADLVVPGTVEQGVHARFIDLLQGRIQRETVLVAHRAEILRRDSVVFRGVETHQVHGAFPQGHPFIRENRFPGDLHPDSQAAAGRAGSIGAVEGEHPGRQLLDGHAAVRTGIVHAVQRFALVHAVDDHQSGTPHGSGCHVLRQAVAELIRIPADQAVHHNLDGMLLLFIQFRRVLQIIHLPVNPHTDIAAFACGGKQIPVFTLPSADQRTEHLHPRSFRSGADRVHNLVH